MRKLLLVLLLPVALLAATALAADASAGQDTLDPTGAPPSGLASSALVSPARPAARPDAEIVQAALVQYSIPVTPTHLLTTANGQVWYSSFFGAALGNLDPATLVSRVYKLPQEKSIFGVALDAAGGVWYTTANAVGGNDAVGRLNTVTNLISEWRLPRNHFGLRIDPATQNAWFVSKGTAADQVGRLNAQTNQMTLWNISPYTDTYNLDIAPNGDVWFTVQPRGLQAVGRLTPSTGQVTIWKLPSPTARPFQLQVISAAEVWLTEFDPSGNSISRLTPSANQLTRYIAPTPGSGPAGLVKLGDRVWFTEYEGHKVGFLEPANATAQVVTLQTQTYTAPATTSTLAPVVIAPQVLKSASTASPVTLIGVRSGGFTEFRLPSQTSYPLEITAGQNDAVWFTESGGLRISKLGSVQSRAGYAIFLPVALR